MEKGQVPFCRAVLFLAVLVISGLFLTGVPGIANAQSVPSVPSAPTITGTAQTSISISWPVVSGATDYHIGRGSADIYTQTGTYYTNSGLLCGTTYQYHIEACNSSGCSAWGSYTSATTLSCSPSTPSAPSVSPTSQTTMSISFSTVSGATSYQLQRSVSGSGQWTLLPSTTAASYGDSGLSPGTSYVYEERACNSSGCSSWSGTSNSATTDASTPGTPTVGTLTPASQGGFSLTWTRNAPYDESGFNIQDAAYQSSPGSPGSVEGNASAGVSSGVAGGVNCNTADALSVRAWVLTNGRYYFSNWSAYSNSATTDQCTPGAPTINSATPYSQTKALVAWTPTAPYTQTGFSLTANGTSSVGVVMLSGGSTSGYMSGLSCGSNYQPMVSSYVLSNGRYYYSNASLYATNVSTVCFSAPTLSGSAYTNTTPALSWSSVSGTGLHNYHLYQNGTLILSTGSTSTTSFLDITANSGNTYSYVVKAVDVDGTEGPASNPVSIVYDTTAPSTPGTPYCSSGCSGSGPWYNASGNFKVSWGASTDNSGGSGLKQYDVRSYTGGNWNLVYVTSSPDSYVANGLAQGTYAYDVSAQDNAGNVSSYSASSPNIIVDTTAPTCGTWLPDPPSWSTGPETFTLSGSTDSGGSGINVSGGSCTVSTNGGTCSVTISDNAGNTRSCTSPAAKIDTTSPTPNPPALSCTATSQSSVSCTITSSEADSLSGLASAPYGFSTSAGGSYGWQSGTSYAFSGLSCGTSYTFYAEARDAVGNATNPASAAASTVSCTPAASAPGTVSAQAAAVSGLSQINASWLSGAASSVYVYYSGSGPNSAAPTLSNTGAAEQFQVACPGTYTVYFVPYNIDPSMGSTQVDSSCSTSTLGGIRAIPQARCGSPQPETVHVQTCTQGFFGNP